MKFTAKLLALLWALSAISVQAQIRTFSHVIVIVQENRTPDNLFQGLCTPPFGTSASCNATNPTGKQYDIKTSNWLDRASATGVTQPTPVALANKYDLSHSHHSWILQCDKDAAGNCKMDGGAKVTCSGTCPVKPQYAYVDNTTKNLDSYLELATQYGWANSMFQTNQGPSFPAHQFIFGATSAPSLAADHAGTFASENIAGKGNRSRVHRKPDPLGSTDRRHGHGKQDQPDLSVFRSQHGCRPSATSRYYLEILCSGASTIWTAPDAIQHICVANGTTCTGADWKANVDLNSAHVLTDIGNCNLRQVTWVVPKGQNSDHAATNTGGGPSWVTSIVNAIGNSWTSSNHKCDYWENNSNDATAIFLVWDDWGGWYDHKAPNIMAAPEGAYQLGFRVPLIVVSAYTPLQTVNNERHDFGSLVRFIEHNFAIPEGALTFADARASTNLTSFFDLTKPARPFLPVKAQVAAAFFVNDKTIPTDPDDD